MTKEEKQLLIKDLCARLPYHPPIKTPSGDRNLYGLNEHNYEATFGAKGPVELIKPYLRPMSSMTAEEEYEYHQCKNIDYLEICEMEHAEMLKTTALCFSHATDWLNKNGFDYRGLIPMGLALEAPEGMYF